MYYKLSCWAVKANALNKKSRLMANHVTSGNQILGGRVSNTVWTRFNLEANTHGVVELAL